MSKFNDSKIRSREDLRKFFRNGEIPTEEHYRTLIESMINKQDDGFARDVDNGMLIASTLKTGRFMALFKNIDDFDPFFVLEKDDKEDASLRLSPAGKEGKSKPDEESFFFHENGSLGLGKRSADQYRLEVNGFAAMDGRTGTWKQGCVPADGRWHPIVKDLHNCQVFEIVARTGLTNTGRFAVAHAIAVCAFGSARNRIRRTGSHFGFFWNRIRFRWRTDKETHKYMLEVKTSSRYEGEPQIYYHISRLWDDTSFLPKAYYHD